MSDKELGMIKMLLGDNAPSDEFIAFYYDSTVALICSYCNIEKIPEGLEPTLIEIVAFRVKANSSGAQASIGEGVKQVASVSDGNQSVSYAGSASGGKQFVSEEDIISAYSYILDRYRRMVVERPHCRHLGARHIRY